MTGKDEVAGAGPRPGTSPGHRPTVSHDLDPSLCTRCEVNPRKDGTVWCQTCILAGKVAKRDSIARQLAAGAPVPERNWKPGDPFWWKASGCYKEDP